MTKREEYQPQEELPPVCPRCNALRVGSLEFCPECGGKITPDRSDESPDCYAAMQGSFRNRINRFLLLCEDVDNVEDVYDQLFGCCD